ncbi:hypothetical protein PoB_004078600 [Plakobranchus ocellatus]|uniref:Uncharacterized protein n=1 Tax=Plakobranchus ocellatus TaxID=259542 RepID=A0AAV4B654_9GAST|nr:hypothetical protein PoB_004078600 [Plakobranchus ocellatus]
MDGTMLSDIIELLDFNTTLLASVSWDVVTSLLYTKVRGPVTICLRAQLGHGLWWETSLIWTRTCERNSKSGTNSVVTFSGYRAKTRVESRELC